MEWSQVNSVEENKLYFTEIFSSLFCNHNTDLKQFKILIDFKKLY